MMELFDMGKYNFFVWTSIGLFIIALLVDYFSASKQLKKTKKQIKAQHRKTNVRRKTT